jgi:hypothetical protein
MRKGVDFNADRDRPPRRRMTFKLFGSRSKDLIQLTA